MPNKKGQLQIGLHLSTYISPLHFHVPILLPYMPSLSIPQLKKQQLQPRVACQQRKMTTETTAGGSRSSSSSSRIRVAIVGGGIAGLALAAGLAKKQHYHHHHHHVDIHVYESVLAYRDVGAGLALHRNAIEAMGLIDAELQRAYARKALRMGEDEDRTLATEVRLAQGPHSGQLVAELGRAKGRKTVSRADLLDGFLELVPPDCISFGKKLVGVEERPIPVAGDENYDDDDGDEGAAAPLLLTFQDGTRAEADCLLGADGVHSFVRRHLLGADHPATTPKNHDGWQIYRVMVSAEEARRQINPKWTQNVPILLGPRGHVNCIPLNKGTRLSAGVAVRRGGEWAATATASMLRSPKDTDVDDCGANGSSRNGNDANHNDKSNGEKQGQQTPLPLDPDLYADYSEEAQQIIRMVAQGDTSASWTLSDHDHAPFYTRPG